MLRVVSLFSCFVFLRRSRPPFTQAGAARSVSGFLWVRLVGRLAFYAPILFLVRTAALFVAHSRAAHSRLILAALFAISCFRVFSKIFFL